MHDNPYKSPEDAPVASTEPGRANRRAWFETLLLIASLLIGLFAVSLGFAGLVYQESVFCFLGLAIGLWSLICYFLSRQIAPV
jgi:uncharacterized membrane protein